MFPYGFPLHPRTCKFGIVNGNAAPGQSGISLTTLAYIVTKCRCQCHVPALNNVGPVLIEASEITRFLGGPSGDSYDSTLPDFGTPLVNVHGISDAAQQ